MRLKEEQLRREEEKLREIELKVQREINEKRQELLAKEESLRSVYLVHMIGSPVCAKHTGVLGIWRAALPLKVRKPSSGIDRHAVFWAEKKRLLEFVLQFIPLLIYSNSSRCLVLPLLSSFYLHPASLSPDILRFFCILVVAISSLALRIL